MNDVVINLVILALALYLDLSAIYIEFRGLDFIDLYNGSYDPNYTLALLDTLFYYGAVGGVLIHFFVVLLNYGSPEVELDE